MNIRESVDSLCRDGTDTPYTQYYYKIKVSSAQVHDNIIFITIKPILERDNPLPTIRNSLKKQKSLYKVLTPSIKTPI